MEVVYLMMLFGVFLIGICFCLVVEGEKKTKNELQGEENEQNNNGKLYCNALRGRRNTSRIAPISFQRVSSQILPPDQF